jgi:hypothetical protein
MAKYVYAKLVDFLKLDAKIIKKSCTNKSLKLSEIQTELAKVFGYRHFHELETLHSKQNIFLSEDIHLNQLTRYKFNELKNKYLSVFTSFSESISYNKSLFDRIIPLWSTTIIRDSKTIVHYNMAANNYKFILNNQLYQELMEIFARQNAYSDPYLEFHVLNFNNLIFDILKYIQSDNFSNDYKNYIGFDVMTDFIKNNKKFKSIYLDNYNILMNNCNEDTKAEQHGYMSMVFSEFCRHPFMDMKFRSKDKKEIIVEELITDNNNHEFHYYDGLPKVINIFFEYIRVLVKKYDDECIDAMDNQSKIELFSKKSVGLMTIKSLDYSLVHDYLKSLDNNWAYDKKPLICFIDNNNEQVKNIIYNQSYSSKRIQFNQTEFKIQYLEGLRIDADIFIMNSTLEGYKEKYVRQAIEIGHNVILLDPKDTFNCQTMLSDFTSVIKLN